MTANNADKLKVLFVASEMAPIAKVGGLGDVIGSLPRALRKIGADARAVIPLYEQINRSGLKKISALSGQTIIYKKTVNQVPTYFIANDEYFGRGPIYFEKTAFAGSKKEIDRFVFFSQAVYRLLARTDADFTQTNADKNSAKSASSQRKSAMSGWRPDIVHCNDWHTGLLIKEIRMQNSKLKTQNFKTVFTIHNLANQGVWNGQNLMAEGIKNADMATTVSPTYAKEILAPKSGEGLESLLRKKNREGKLVGILNGIDYDFWPSRKRNKKSFQKNLKIGQNDKVPVFGLVSRLTRQKGIRLIIPLVADFVRKYRAQFVFLGQGEEEIEIGLKKLARRFPKNVYVKIGFDEKLAQAVYAQSDFFLMPSRFEPSGLGQMIAMRYGTVPIVRATGGLKDTVADGKTGIVFREESSAGLENALSRAVNLFYKTPRKLKTMANNCKKQNFSWNRASEKYLRIYRALLTSF